MSKLQLIKQFFVCYAYNFACFAVINYFLKKNCLVIQVILFSISIFAQAQTKLQPEVILNIAEELAADESDPEAVSVFIEWLQELSDNPVMINSGNENEISRLFFLSEYQVRTLTSHVKSSGKVVSPFEIATIPGYDKATVEIMIPFIMLDEYPGHTTDSAKWRNSFMTNFAVFPGEKDTACIGSSARLLTKYKISAGWFSAGFTTEKDFGEQLLDFVSGYVSYSGKGILKKIIAGDFSVRFGQGTNINTGMHTGLLLTSAGYMPGRNEIRPYTSSDENNFLRGAAAMVTHKNVGCTFFFSKNRIDASTCSSADTSIIFAESLYTSGLHNKPSLLAKKDALALTCLGADMTVDIKSLRIGFAWSESFLSIPLRPDADNPENLYKFNGKNNPVYTLYYNGQLRKFLLYGEISLNDERTYAMVNGINIKPSDRLTLNFMLRNYSPGFTSFYGKGPGILSSTANEQGILGNITFEAARNLFIMAGTDFCRFPWLRYRTSFLSYAKRYEARLRYAAGERTVFDVSYSYRYSMSDSGVSNGIASIAESKTGTIKAVARYTPKDNVTLTTRFDFKRADPGSSRGMLILQDFVCRFRQLPLSLWLRYCIYNTDDWYSRLYTYENDLLYSFSIPALSGEGTRSYVMAKWDFGNRAELRIKYGLISKLENRTMVENRDELKMQFRIWF